MLRTRLGLAAAGLLIGVMVLEGGLRLYSKFDPPFSVQLAAQAESEPKIEAHGEIGYRQRPGAVFRYANGTEARANELGFRGPTVGIPKPPGRLRIVLLGESTTHGWSVNDEDTIDAHMRRLLEARYPGRAFDVVNLAFDGYDSYQLLERLRTDGVRLDPDILIVNAGVNDVRNAIFPDLQDPDPRTLLYRISNRTEGRGWRSRAWSWLKRRSYLARLPGFALAIASGTAFSQARKAAVPSNRAAEYFGRNLGRIAEVVSERRVPILFSTPPSALRTTKYRPSDRRATSYWLTDAGETQAYRDLLAGEMRTVAERLTQQGYPAHYVGVELDARLFMDDCHLTAAGNAVMADALLAAVEPWISGGQR